MKSQYHKLGILAINAGLDMVWCLIVGGGSVGLHQKDRQLLTVWDSKQTKIDVTERMLKSERLAFGVYLGVSVNFEWESNVCNIIKMLSIRVFSI